jgi:hypothetical protein
LFVVMAEVFVVRNQLGHYWGKGKAWVDGTEPKAVMRARHEDEALNTLFELSSKDFEMRGEVLAVELSERGEPVVEPSANLIPKEAPEPVVEEGSPAQEQNGEPEPTAAP